MHFANPLATTVPTSKTPSKAAEACHKNTQKPWPISLRTTASNKKSYYCYVARTFTVTIPAKAHIAKFAAVRYGSHIRISNKSTIGALMVGLLQKPKFDSGHPNRSKNVRFIHFNSHIKFVADIADWYKIGSTLSDDHIIAVNTFLENEFSDRLAVFVWAQTNHSNRRKGIEKAIQQFANLYNIDTDIDITLDGLIKMEYRRRKYLQQSLPHLSPHHTIPFPNLL